MKKYSEMSWFEKFKHYHKYDNSNKNILKPCLECEKISRPSGSLEKVGSSVIFIFLMITTGLLIPFTIDDSILEESLTYFKSIFLLIFIIFPIFVGLYCGLKGFPLIYYYVKTKDNKEYTSRKYELLLGIVYLLMFAFIIYPIISIPIMIDLFYNIELPTKELITI